MFSVDVPRGADGQPLLPEDIWQGLHPAAQVVVVALAQVAQRVVTLEAEVRELKARLGQNSTNSSRPPSHDPPQAPRRSVAPTGRPPGGQPGHVAHQRAVVSPERVDRIIDHRPTRCGQCARALPVGSLAGLGDDFVAHQVTEVPPLRSEVTEHRLHRVRCPACGAQTRAALPLGVPRGAFGPRLQATVAVLSGRYRLSRREVADVCETVLDAPLGVGSVDGLCQATADALATPVAEVAATLPATPLANADETRWRQAGQTRWLWTVVTPLATVFVIASSRDSRIIKGLLGEAFAGILGSDRWSAYGWLDVALRQICWAHLKRDFQALVDRGGAAGPVGVAALALIHDLFATWHQFRDGAFDRAALQARLQPVQGAFGRVLDDGARCPDAKAAGLCRALDRLWPALWTFLEVDGVDPTNNAAERALRPAVLWRKGSLGTQSDGGARFVERMLTVVATCKQHSRSVLDYLTTVCIAAQLGQPVPSLLPVTA
ncbi:MAG TPA: IS66 family transposase [Actinomycetes bacterium]|jgi:transposase|nr:IS66 family transposase [Actinomycetes bacterium]